jgi:hypothetical protein
LALRGFYVWVGIYIAVSLFLLINNLITDPYNLWFYWPMLGGAMLLAVYGITIVAFGQDWEERKVRQIMQQERESAPEREPTELHS